MWIEVINHYFIIFNDVFYDFSFIFIIIVLYHHYLIFIIHLILINHHQQSNHFHLHQHNIFFQDHP